MNLGPGFEKQQKLVAEIQRFLRGASGLNGLRIDVYRFQVCQHIDNKAIVIDGRKISDVILRSDVAGDEFVQVNFEDGKKILLTNTLIGFKPTPCRGLEAARIPRVVTTPDVLNVFEAIQDAIHLSGADSDDVVMLKRVFDSVLSGGEAIGFDLAAERAWLARISHNTPQFSS